MERFFLRLPFCDFVSRGSADPLRMVLELEEVQSMDLLPQARLGGPPVGLLRGGGECPCGWCWQGNQSSTN